LSGFNDVEEAEYIVRMYFARRFVQAIDETDLDPIFCYHCESPFYRKLKKEKLKIVLILILVAARLGESVAQTILASNFSQRRNNTTTFSSRTSPNERI
jgi:hypothetical protein